MAKKKNILFRCTCGKRFWLKLVGGQYQYTWKGTCTNCGTLWYADCEGEDG
jgi:hypothetical protein